MIGTEVRVLRILVCTHCRPLLTVPLDPVSPQFLRELDAWEVLSRLFSRLSCRSDVHKALRLLSWTLTSLRRTVCLRNPWTRERIPTTAIVFHEEQGKKLDCRCDCLRPPMFRLRPLRHFSPDTGTDHL